MNTSISRSRRSRWALVSALAAVVLIVGGKRCCVPNWKLARLMPAAAIPPQGELINAKPAIATARTLAMQFSAPVGETPALRTKPSPNESNSTVEKVANTAASAEVSRASSNTELTPVADPYGIQAALQTPTTTAEAPSAPATSQPLADEQRISFSLLGDYTLNWYQYKDARKDSSFDLDAAVIPEKIRALNGKRVVIHGFMQPMDFSGGRLASFMLVGDMMDCCFGNMPRINDWIDVELAPPRDVALNIYAPVVVTGTLEVGCKFLNGFVDSVYRLRAEKVQSVY